MQGQEALLSQGLFHLGKDKSRQLVTPEEERTSLPRQNGFKKRTVKDNRCGSRRLCAEPSEWTFEVETEDDLLDIDD